MRSKERMGIFLKLLIVLFMLLPNPTVCSMTSDNSHELQSLDENIVINEEIAQFIVDACYYCNNDKTSSYNQEAMSACCLKIHEKSYIFKISELVDVFPVLVTYFNQEFSNLTRVLPKQFACVLPFLNFLQTQIENCCNGLNIAFDVLFNNLSVTQTTLIECCTGLAADFDFTFSLIENMSMSFTIVVDFGDQFITTWTLIADINDTLTACCETIEQNFITTQTLIVDIENTVTACCAAITQAINETFTSLSFFSNTFTLCCDETQQELIATFTFIEEGANATFTIVASLQDTLTQCCALSAASFNGTFTVEAAGFNGTFTLLDDILNTMIICCAQSGEICNTATIIEAGFNGTFTAIADINNTLTECCAAIAANFAGTFSTLNSTLTNTTVNSFAETINANFCNPTFLTTADFGPGGTTPYTITTSGVYKFAEDMAYTAAGASSAIVIAANNVTLDLQCFTLVQTNNPGVANVNGILINSNVTDVTIKNGAIFNFSRTGISVQSNVNRLEIDGVTAVECDFRGFEFIGAAAPNRIEDVVIKDCVIRQCSSGGGDTALQIGLCNRFVIKNTQLFENSGGNFVAITIDTCSNIALDDVRIVNNGGALSFIGVNIISSQLITGNKVDILYNSVDDFRGIQLTTSTFNIFKNCNISYNVTNQVGGLPPTNAFRFQTSSNNNIIMNCVMKNQQGPTNEMKTINVVASQNNSIISCIVDSNRQIGGDGTGINFESSSDFNYVGKTIISHGVGVAYLGIRIAGASDNNAIIDNQFIQNNGGSANLNTYGIDVVLGSNNFFTRNIAFNNGGNPAQYNGLPAGSVSTPVAPASSNLTAITAPWTNMAIGK